jgi:hypothetical protein
VVRAHERGQPGAEVGEPIRRQEVLDDRVAVAADTRGVRLDVETGWRCVHGFSLRTTLYHALKLPSGDPSWPKP